MPELIEDGHHFNHNRTIPETGSSSKLV
jgi:hypothetical protein